MKKITITREQLRKALNNPNRRWLELVCPISIEIEVDEGPAMEEPIPDPAIKRNYGVYMDKGIDDIRINFKAGPKECEHNRSLERDQLYNPIKCLDCGKNLLDITQTEPNQEGHSVLMSPAIAHGCITNLLFSDFNQVKRQYSSLESWPLKIVIKNIVGFPIQDGKTSLSGELFIEVNKEEK